MFRKVADIAWVTIAMTGNLMRTTEDVHAAVTGDRDSRGPAVARLSLAAALIAADLAWIVTMRRNAGGQRSRP